MKLTANGPVLTPPAATKKGAAVLIDMASASGLCAGLLAIICQVMPTFVDEAYSFNPGNGQKPDAHVCGATKRRRWELSIVCAAGLRLGETVWCFRTRSSDVQRVVGRSFLPGTLAGVSPGTLALRSWHWLFCSHFPRRTSRIMRCKPAFMAR